MLLPTGSLRTVTTVETREVRLHGHRLVYRIGGDLVSDRPVLLFVHGVAGSAVTWKAVMQVLASRYTVIAPDLPGHGDSDKPRVDYSLGAYANVLRDLMIALRIERATIVGHSLGGGVAMQLAYQHPRTLRTTRPRLQRRPRPRGVVDAARRSRCPAPST